MGNRVQVEIVAELLDGRVLLHPETVVCGSGWIQKEAVFATSPVLEFFWEKLQQLESPNVVDIGAGSGRFSLLATQAPDAAFMSYEPHPKRHGLLARNIVLNELEDRVWLSRAALGYRHRSARMYVPFYEGDAGDGTIGSISPLRSTGYVTHVAVRKLDDALNISDQVDLMKISTNGAEKWVLMGAARLINTWVPDCLIRATVDCKHNCGYDRDDIRLLMESWGYKVTMPEKDWLWCEYHARAN